MSIVWGDVLQTVSVVVACATAIYGVDSWRRESLGKRKMELAEDVLSMFYNARNAFAAMRNIFGYSSEGQATPEAGEAAVQVERYMKHKDLWGEMDAKRYRFQAYFGLEAVKPFSEISNLLHQYMSAPRRLKRLEQLAMNAEHSSDENRIENCHTQIEEIESIIYGMGGEDDAFAQKVEAAIQKIEKICDPVLRVDTGEKYQRATEIAIGTLVMLLVIYLVAASF
jgi:hypothetical protein